MSDSLRDRIAAALKSEDEKPHICPFDSEPTMASYDRLADAVIEALALKEERHRPYSMRRDWQGDWRHRYVTEWTTDEAR